MLGCWVGEVDDCCAATWETGSFSLLLTFLPFCAAAVSTTGWDDGCAAW